MEVQGEEMTFSIGISDFKHSGQAACQLTNLIIVCVQVSLYPEKAFYCSGKDSDLHLHLIEGTERYR